MKPLTPLTTCGKRRYWTLGDVVNFDTFENILDLDDARDSNFSYNLMSEYFEFAEKTITSMDQAFRANLKELTTLSERLSESSTALGLVEVHETCQQLKQHCTQANPCLDENLDTQQGLIRVVEAIRMIQVCFGEAKIRVVRFIVIEHRAIASRRCLQPQANFATNRKV